MKHSVLLSIVAALAMSSGCGPKKFPLTDISIVAAKDDAELVARGEYLFHGAAHCAGCHTTIEQGLAIKGGDRPAPTGGHVWQMGPVGTLYSPNITPDQETGVGKWSDAELARVIKYGVRPDGTISHFMRFGLGEIADDDISAILSYLRSIPPVANEVPRSELGILGGMVLGGLEPRPHNTKVAPPLAATIERGRYLAYGPANCVGCHSETDGFAIKAGREFVGASEPMHSEVDDDPNMYLAPNLTSDASGIGGKWTEEQFMARIKEGRTLKGTPMAWGNLQNLHDDDIRALWLFMKSLPPVAKEFPLTVVPKK